MHKFYALLMNSNTIYHRWLRHLSGRSYVKLRVQTDSLKVASAIQEGLKRRSNSALMRRILQRLSRFHHWSICRIPREENRKVDRLVKLAHLNSQGLQVFEVSPFGEKGYVM